MMNETCCVTGHRHIPSMRVREVKDRLVGEVGGAIGDGYTRFVCGFAEGIDLLFADTIVGWKTLQPKLRLVAALPYRDRLQSRNPMFRALLAQCDEVYVINDERTRECYFARNRWMVNESGRVIAVCDGRSGGGTVYTLRYAKEQKKEIRMVAL